MEKNHFQYWKRYIKENLITYINELLAMVVNKYFNESIFLKMIKVIGENINPISYLELKKKTGLPDTTLYRGLNWLQDKESVSGWKKKELEALYLIKNRYIESTGINKSKNNAYKLTKNGLEIFNGMFLEKKKISFIDEIIQDYKIYEKLWQYIEENEELFLKRVKINEVLLEPWTLQIFEFFNKKDEQDIANLLNFISGPKNLRLNRLFQKLTVITLSNPLWLKMIEKKDIEYPNLKREDLDFLNQTSLGEDFEIFGTYPKVYCIYKLDKLIKETRLLIKKYLKISYWKSIVYFTQEDILLKNIISRVLSDIYTVCPEYYNFIKEYSIEFSIFLKNFIKRVVSNNLGFLKCPISLLSSQDRNKFDFYLRRKILQVDIENLPSRLLKMGASKEILYEVIDRLKIQSEKHTKNMQYKLKLLEILVYNFSFQLRNELQFYQKWKIGLDDYIKKLLDECLEANTDYQVDFLILGYIFYQKYLDKAKFLEICEDLFYYYPEDENFLETLIKSYYSQEILNWNKVARITDEMIDAFPNNLFFNFSKFILNLIQQQNEVSKNLLKKKLLEILKIKVPNDKLIEVIYFYLQVLKREGLNKISLDILEVLIEKIQSHYLNWIYGEYLLFNQDYVRAIEIFLKLIDVFPNRFLESKIFKILLNKNLIKEDFNNDAVHFLKKIYNHLRLLGHSYEWSLNKGDVKDFEEKRNEHLLRLKSSLKDLNKLLNNPFTKILPLKIKAIILRALNHQKSYENTLNKILNINPDIIWANSELAFHFLTNKEFEQTIKILEKVEFLKERDNFSTPFLLYNPFTYLIEHIDYNIFHIYKESGNFNKAILIIEDFLTNPYAEADIKVTASSLAQDLIFCYDQISSSIDDVIEKILKLVRNIETNQKLENNNIINIQKDSSYIKQALIDFVFDQNQHEKTLNLILKLNENDSSILDTKTSFFPHFNKNIYYIAECYLKLNNFFLAKKYFEKAHETIIDDLGFDTKTLLKLITPFPDYLKIHEKTKFLKKIEKGKKRINLELKKGKNLINLVFKTDLEKSIGNICILIKQNDRDYISKDIKDQLKSINYKDQKMFGIVIVCSYALTGYIDEMINIIKKYELRREYPIISRLLELLYYYYESDSINFNKHCLKLHKLIPSSLFPLLLNLFYLRFKRGLKAQNQITQLFKSIWGIYCVNFKLYGDEKTIFNYLRNNLTWYPFKWAIEYENYIRSHSVMDKSLIFGVLNFIEENSYEMELETYEFVTYFLETDRKITDYLELLLIIKRYKYPTTKYFILKMLDIDLDKYGLRHYGEIAYSATKLNEIINQIEELKKIKIRESKKWRSSDFQEKFLEEQFLLLLLNSFNNSDHNEKIINSIKFFNSIKEYPEEKLRFFNILLDLRNQHYRGAELKAYQLLIWFKDEGYSRWDDKYLKIWILTKILSDITQSKEFNPTAILIGMKKLVDYNKLNKNLDHFYPLILDTLDHELLSEHEDIILKFGYKAIIEIFNSLNWNDNKSLELLAEKLYFKKELNCLYNIEILPHINNLIEKLNPSNLLFKLRKEFLLYLKAMIMFKNGKLNDAKIILNNFFKTKSENELYTTYIEFIDLSMILEDENSI